MHIAHRPRTRAGQRVAVSTLGLLLAAAALAESTGAGYSIRKDVIAGGGSASSGGNYALIATVGQSVSGQTQSSGQQLQQGFHPATFAQADGLFQNGFE